MKSPFRTVWVVVAAIAATLPAFAQETERPVAVRTEGMPEQLRLRIEAKAQEGQTALIQYLNRTRNIHNLWPRDVIRPAPEVALARGDGDHGLVVVKSPGALPAN